MSWSYIQYIRQQKTPFILINSKLSIIIVDYGKKWGIVRNSREWFDNFLIMFGKSGSPEGVS